MLFTAYSIVRTVPSANRPSRRKKKKKAFPNTVLNEILVQLANLKVRYHFMNYRRLAIFGPPSLVINLHLSLLPFDVHLPIGPKQGAFTVHMLRSEPHCAQTAHDYNHFQVKFGKIGSFQYAHLHRFYGLKFPHQYVRRINSTNQTNHL